MGARSLDLGSSKQGKRSLSPRGTLKDEEKEGTACWSVRLDRVFPLQGLSPCLNGREGRTVRCSSLPGSRMPGTSGFPAPF